MVIENDKVVTMHFTLTSGTGEALESTDKEEAFQYIHGAMEILPALEEQLTGKNPGEKYEIKIASENAYGDRDAELVEVVEKTEFASFDAEIEAGMEIEMETEEGVFPVFISKVEGDQVTVDMNHPLAGMDLIFNVDITEVRDATKEELDHGHVHNGTSCEH